MLPPEISPSENKEKRSIYTSPSRLSVVTPIRNALKSSNNNVRIFLEKLEELNKFKKGIEKLDLKKSKSDGVENEITHT